MILRFEVPGAPVGKGRPKVSTMGGKFARMYTPEKTVSYEGLVAHSAKVAMNGSQLFAGPVHIDMDIRLAVPVSWSKKKQAAALADQVMPTKKPDADNVIKAIFDGMNGVVWVDDVQAVSMSMRKRYAETPCVLVSVKAMEAQPA